MALTFYYAPLSTASVTEIILEELELPCEKVKLKLGEDTKKPDFLALNPNGKVPVIVHDGQVVFESAAITLYLGETFGVEKGLWPAPGPARGEAMKWVVWANVTLGMATVVWKNTKDDAELHRVLGIFDANLAGKEYLAANTFSLADAHLNSFLDWLRFSKVDLSRYSHIAAWSGRVQQRPGYQRWLASMRG